MQESQLLAVGVFSVVACAFIFVSVNKLKEAFTAQDQTSSQIEKIPTSSSMHFFANNQCSPSCCMHSNYSCNSGCVCLSDAQRDALTTRGNNASSRAPDLL